uniref:Uncharacterized protein n=1 Tax=Panagrellus redivivus TaxID=6233 RepID=A0A7E4V9P2_PANRE
MFSFRPEELYDFVAKQGPEFRLQLYIKTNDICLTDKIKPFIDPRFRDGDFGSANFLVSIDHNISSGLHCMEYVIPGSEKDWFTDKITKKRPHNADFEAS